MVSSDALSGISQRKANASFSNPEELRSEGHARGIGSDELRFIGAWKAPGPQTAGTDPFRQAELVHLARISDRLDTIIVILAFILVATVISTVLFILGR